MHDHELIKVEDASVHNAVSKVNVALKRAQPGADFISTVPGVGIEILVKVDPAPAMEDKGDGATGAMGQESAVSAEPPTLTVVGSKLLFRIKWYKNTFGDWHCGMIGASTDWKTNSLPPAGY